MERKPFQDLQEIKMLVPRRKRTSWVGRKIGNLVKRAIALTPERDPDPVAEAQAEAKAAAQRAALHTRVASSRRRLMKAMRLIPNTPEKREEGDEEEEEGDWAT
ncbi:hypothetical protein HYH03_004655 [Edaphochlamys debaryana]|uniref:Uncharacterized protein n=1 Tax=Edaphochlamys debaryana TaxID=47281 RepID=A0A836C373_9CHLO|nr:hypothetical protein HYH03_004655 [Edaphochlamys debaryana]|eukprot:KAG2497503.1 hypothetical protein HYH03_004655 [Edaphochlamys debaryana]